MAQLQRQQSQQAQLQRQHSQQAQPQRQHSQQAQQGQQQAGAEGGEAERLYAAIQPSAGPVLQVPVQLLEQQVNSLARRGVGWGGGRTGEGVGDLEGLGVKLS